MSSLTSVFYSNETSSKSLKQKTEEFKLDNEIIFKKYKDTKTKLFKKTLSINIKPPKNKNTSYSIKQINESDSQIQNSGVLLKFKSKDEDNTNNEKEINNKITEEENPYFFDKKKSKKLTDTKFKYISSKSLRNYNNNNFHLETIKEEFLEKEIPVNLNLDAKKSIITNKFKSSITLKNFNPKSVKFTDELTNEIIEENKKKDEIEFSKNILNLSKKIIKLNKKDSVEIKSKSKEKLTEIIYIPSIKNNDDKNIKNNYHIGKLEKPSFMENKETSKCCNIF
jgi:hypothetical protein